MKKKLVLVYGFGDREQMVCQIVTSCKAEPRVVAPEELDETIGHLCGMPGYPAAAAPAATPLDRPMVIFCDLSEKELDQVLSGLRESQVAADALKAMVTKTNTGWTMRDLAKELEVENRTMNAMAELKRYRDSLGTPSVLNVQLMMAMMQADMILNGQVQPTIQQILQARMNLQKAAEGR